MSDIFISYARKDRPKIKPLVDALQRRGWTVWWDPTILAGKDWQREIEAALTASSCVIVAWSRAAIESDWVRSEADVGKQRNILVPVMLEPVELPLPFRLLQTVSLVDWRGETPNAQFEQVAKAIEELLGSVAPKASEAAAARTGDSRPHERMRAAKKALNWSRWREVAKSGMALGGMLLFMWASLPWRQILNLRKNQPHATKNPQSVQTMPDPAPNRAKNPESATPILGTTPLVERRTRSATAVVAPGTIRQSSKDRLQYVWVPAGSFVQGCSNADFECRDDETPAHRVSISEGFWIGQTTVTQEPYVRIMENNPSKFAGSGMPVDSVIWSEAKHYCEAVGMRLPTEAEWEYAARAGTTWARYGDIDAIAWYAKDSGTRPVQKKAPNAWRLYDMLGNVWQWTADWYGDKYYTQKELIDPKGPIGGIQRSVRGGAWMSNPIDIRASSRKKFAPDERYYAIGVRCVGEKVP